MQIPDKLSLSSHIRQKWSTIRAYGIIISARIWIAWGVIINLIWYGHVEWHTCWDGDRGPENRSCVLLGQGDLLVWWCMWVICVGGSGAKWAEVAAVAKNCVTRLYVRVINPIAFTRDCDRVAGKKVLYPVSILKIGIIRVVWPLPMCQSAGFTLIFIFPGLSCCVGQKCPNSSMP